MSKSDFHPRRNRGIKRRGPVFAAALLASSALTGVAFAQVVEEDEIIVTATKRSENIQDIPLSVQALGENFLAEQQVQSFDDYAALLPSVSFQSFGPGQAQVAFRGVSSGGDGLHIGPRPTAATYLDDAPVTTVANTVDLRVYDVARIEALSGPQGTLFGASALSGVVRVITNQPDPSGFEGGYDVEANSFTEGEMGGSVEGFLNVPLSNNVALRLVGYYDRDGGYIDNVPGTRTFTLGDTDPLTNVTVNNNALVEDDFNNVETYGGRAALRIDLNENWTSTTSVIAQNQETEGPFLFDPQAGDLAVRDFLPTNNSDEWWMASQTIQGRIGNFDMVYSGSYFDRRVDNESDYSYYTVAYDSLAGYYYTYIPDGTGGFLDPTQSVVLGDDYTKQSHELRIVSPAENRFRFTAGLFYQTQENNIEADYIIRGISAVPVPPAPPQITVPVTGFGDSVFRTRITREDEDFAVFGEVSFDLTEQLTLTAGGRSFNTENSILGFSGFQFNADNPNCLPTTATDRPCDNVNKTFEEDGTTYRVSAAYDIDDDRMVYATISTGYRPGGNNRRPGIVPYVSDTLTNYEFGWKTQWADRAVRFNGSVFFQEWEDLQFGLSPLGSLGVTNTYNAGSAEILGLELDGSWVVDNWTFSGSASLIGANLTSDFCNFDALGNSVCVPGDPPAAGDGTRLPIQPEFKTTLSARYEFTLGGNDAFAQGTLFHQGGTRSFLTDADFAAVGPTDAFTTLDLSTGIDFAGHAWELYVNNVFDERGILSRNTACATSFCGVYARSYPTQPRLVGVRMSRRF
jgi:iron complex outermembrane recepter protein